MMCDKLEKRENIIPQLKARIEEIRLKAANKRNFVEDRAMELQNILRENK